jgi:hypothetical protein
METIPLFNDQAALLDATPILHRASPQDLAAHDVFQQGEGRLVETD